MGAVVLVARLQLRRRARSLLVIAIVGGFAGGAALALIAGSRRSASVVDRYFASGIPYDLSVGGTGLTRAQMLALPMVERADRESYLGLMHAAPDGRIDGGVNGLAVDFDSLDPTFRFVAGRAPAADDRTGVIINEALAKQYGVQPGDEFQVLTFAQADLPDVGKGVYLHPHGPKYTFHITGVVRTPQDIALDKTRAIGVSAQSTSNELFVPYTWYEPLTTTNPKPFLQFDGAYDVQLKTPSDRAAFQAAVANASPAATNGFQPPRFSERRGSFTTPVGFETGVLLALGVAIALAGAVVVGLLLRAEQRRQSSETPVLRGLGFTRSSLAGAAALRTVPAALVAAIVAIVFAYTLSGRFPVGVGRLLELNPGLDANLAVLAIGAAVVVVFIVAVAYALGFSRHRAPGGSRARGTLARWLFEKGAPTDPVIGTQLAFERGGGTGVPTRPAIAGGALALAIVAAIAVFLASVDTLYTSRPAHGWSWDVMVGNVNFPLDAAATVSRDPRLARSTLGAYGQVTLNGTSTEALAVDPRGTAMPKPVAGRIPRTANEIALGPKLMARLHANIGSTVRLSFVGSEFLQLIKDPPEAAPPLHDVDTTVVGEALTPVLGESELAQEAIITTDAFAAAGLTGRYRPQPALALVRFDDARLRADPGLIRNDFTADITTDVVPARVVNLRRVRNLPALGALIAALLGTVLVGYTLAVGVRARTRELGVLRALGMSTRRVGRVLAWQGAVIAGAIVLVGLPGGMLLGIAAWRHVANDFGVATAATFSIGLVLLIPATIAVGLLASIIPARRARHDDVATLLRVE